MRGYRRRAIAEVASLDSAYATKDYEFLKYKIPSVLRVTEGYPTLAARAYYYKGCVEEIHGLRGQALDSWAQGIECLRRQGGERHPVFPYLSSAIQSVYPMVALIYVKSDQAMAEALRLQLQTEGLRCFSRAIEDLETAGIEESFEETLATTTSVLILWSASWRRQQHYSSSLEKIWLRTAKLKGGCTFFRRGVVSLDSAPLAEILANQKPFNWSSNIDDCQLNSIVSSAYRAVWKKFPPPFFSCFISYSHEDRDFAIRLYSNLKARGVSCWIDEHEMLPGDDIYTKVDQDIHRCDKVLLCCSRASLTSWWVDSEIAMAFEKERKLMKDRGEKLHSLIPLILDNYLYSGKWKSGKALEVRSRFAADFTGWDNDSAKFKEGIERLIRALRIYDPKGTHTPKPQL